MEIRLARNRDIDEILIILNDAKRILKENGINQWQNDYPNKEVFLNDIKKRSLHLVVEEGQLLGFASLDTIQKPSYENIEEGKWLINAKEYLSINRLAVKSGFYNKGIGKALFNFAEELAKTKRLKSIRVDTHQDNFIMLNFLKRFGFEYCGKIYFENIKKEENLRLAYEKVI